MHSAGRRTTALPDASAIRLVGQYFADINAHHYAAAFSIETTCPLTLVVRYPGRSGVRSTLGLPARGTSAKLGARFLSYVQTARVTSIRVFSAPVLRRYHLVGVWASGYYRFVYPPPSQSFDGNNERPSGYHRVTIVLRRCGSTQWGIDPGWIYDTGGLSSLTWR